MLTAVKIIFLVTFLVLIHEGGHFIVSKLCKVKVNEFSIGFGPQLLKKQKGETLYSIRAIPLGGFVRLEGEEEESESENSFSKASIPKRIAILLAGGMVNIILGLLIYLVLITIRYVMVRNSGITEALNFGFSACGEMIIEMAKGIGMIFTGKVTLDDMTGPIGISSMVSKTNGFIEFAYLLSIVSISLGITNLLPIVPLDGGKILLLIIEAIRKKPLNKEFEMKLQATCFLLIIILSIIIAYRDILKL